MSAKSIFIVTVFAGLVMSPVGSTQAVVDYKNQFLDPSTACQLSVPSTSTAVRPKATGYRNEGTTSAFVICGTAQWAGQPIDELPSKMMIQMIAFDGASHNVSCTGVSRSSYGATGEGSIFYSTKNVAVSSSGASITWLPADLGDFIEFSDSMTCTLPPGVAITGTRLYIPVEIGA